MLNSTRPRHLLFLQCPQEESKISSEHTPNLTTLKARLPSRWSGPRSSLRKDTSRRMIWRVWEETTSCIWVGCLWASMISKSRRSAKPLVNSNTSTWSEKEEFQRDIASSSMKSTPALRKPPKLSATCPLVQTGWNAMPLTLEIKDCHSVQLEIKNYHRNRLTQLSGPTCCPMKISPTSTFSWL